MKKGLLKFLTPIVLIALFFSQSWSQEMYKQSGSSVKKEYVTTLPMTKTPQKIKVEIIDELVIYDGDIILGREVDFEGSNAVAIDGQSYRWPNSTIPYVIAAGHPKKTEIEWGINHINAKTNICMVPRTNQVDYVEFTTGSGCASYVGKQGGRQYITIGPCSQGSVAHEILHAAGMYHEQSREDRDNFITVNISNVQDGYANNFIKQISNASDIGGYDYGSIMHYPKNAFSKNGQNTININMPPGTASTTIGQRNSLSSMDITAINSLYSRGACKGKEFLLQTGTGLEQTNEKWDFQVADWDQDGKLDLIAIKKSGTGSKSTELHVLSGASKYKNFILQTGTKLEETNENWEFQVSDWDGDKRLDLIAIKKSRTGSKSTELHVLSGASNYQNFILHTATKLEETAQNWNLQLADWDNDGKLDLVGVKKFGTGSKSTELHVLSGASNYQNFILQTGTKLEETNQNWEFQFTDWDKDGKLDFVALKKSETGKKSTEVHILSRSSNFKSFILQVGTVLHETNQNWVLKVVDWNKDSKPDIFGICKRDTGTKTTEVHVLPIQ